MSAITYLLQVSGCLGLFYIFYYLMLNRLTFFTINRYYLLVTLALSFLIPLLIIPMDAQEPMLQPVKYLQAIKTVSDHVKAMPNAKVVNNSGINWLLVLTTVYLFVTATLALQLLFTVFNFFLKTRHKRIKRVGSIRIFQGDKKMANGSFFNYIFLNANNLDIDALDQIVAHEMLHVKLVHSADRVIFKIAQIILWFNPFVYLYARSAEENHEFEVDCEITKSTNKTAYADLLLQLSIAPRGIIYNNFSAVPLKKRMMMLFNKPSSTVMKLIYVLALPVAVLSCMAFSTFKTGNKAVLAPSKSGIPVKEISFADVAHTQDITPAKTLPRETPSVVNLINKGIAVLSNKFSDTINHVSVIGGLEGTGPNPLVLIDGKEYPSKILYEISYSCLNGTAVYSGKPAVEKFGAKAKDGCVEIKTKTGHITYMNALEKDNRIKEKSVPETQFYSRIQLKKANGEVYDEIIMHPPGASSSTTFSHGGKVAFFIDKKYYSEDNIKNLPPEMIASITGAMGVIDLTPSLFPKVNLHGYEAIFYFCIKDNDVADYHFELHLPENE